jgi:catechol 2,3-dioxygenase-like lactoylglutathione lyase family enzyme
LKKMFSFVKKIKIMTPHIIGSLQAVSVVTNCWEQSLRFYTEGLGYHLLETGELSENQKQVFSEKLGKYALLGHQEGSVVRLLENSDNAATPIRLSARPWDCGMAVFEAGTPDVERAYEKVIRARFGALAVPTEFDCEGPEPLGYVLMKSTAFMGPAGEQIFVTQIVGRKGGQSLLKEKAIDGINTPANLVISIKNREIQEKFWRDIVGIIPVNDLPMKQAGAAAIMGGPADMGFDMCLMGHGMERVGMEQHVYEEHNPDYDFTIIPTTFDKTGLASAAWFGQNLVELKEKLIKGNFEIISKIGLPVRDNPEPKGLVFRGPYGEIIELLN